LNSLYLLHMRMMRMGHNPDINSSCSEGCSFPINRESQRCLVFPVVVKIPIEIGDRHGLHPGKLACQLEDPLSKFQSIHCIRWFSIQHGKFSWHDRFVAGIFLISSTAGAHIAWGSTFPNLDELWDPTSRCRWISSQNFSCSRSWAVRLAGKVPKLFRI
jgi:hypothetical protein